MTMARIEKRYYNAESPEAADIYAFMQITVELPPAPYVGMEVRTGRNFLKLDRISWDAEEQKFSCTATPSFLDRMSIDSPDFDEWIEWQEHDGWKLRGRYDNYDFKVPEDSTIKDEEDREWDEIEVSYGRLTETGKIEFHRRHDRALLVGSIAAKQWWMLDAARTRLVEKTSDAKKLAKWIWVSIALYGFYSFVFQESMGGANWLLFAIVGAMAVIVGRLNDDAIERTVSEIVLLEESYRRSCAEWDMLTGMRLDKDKVEIEMAALGYGYEEGLDKHYRSIRRGILSKLRIFQDSTALRWG
jgi:hypothetical protein